MRKSGRKRKGSGINFKNLLRVLKAALVGCVLTIIAVLVFALILKWNIIHENGVTVATSIIKAICAAFAGLLCANGCDGRGWLWGGFAGSLYIAIAFLAFSFVEKMFLFNLGLLSDVCMGFVAGVAGSMIIKLRAR
ncbi:TIGR04086 family membrane protein [Eubacteriales bacterium OttesenSCG-928-K08]|nr:TIGR04086 family membrane protein [Eubacteriales bacterium OttesenSCG-928-K08]